MISYSSAIQNIFVPHHSQPFTELFIRSIFHMALNSDQLMKCVPFYLIETVTTLLGIYRLYQVSKNAISKNKIGPNK